MSAVVLAVVCLVVGVGLGLLWGLTHPITLGPAAAPPTPSISPSAPMPAPSSVLQAAATCFSTQQLPGTTVPRRPAPDLTDLGLHVMAGGNGYLADHATTTFAYASPRQSVFVFIGNAPFGLGPPRTNPDTYRVDGLTVVSTSEHPMLVVGTDATLVASVAARLA